MFQFIRPYLGWIAISIALSLIIVSLEGLSYWFSGSLVQALFSPDELAVTKPAALSFKTYNLYLKYLTYQLIGSGDKFDMLKMICMAVALTFLFKNLFDYAKGLLLCMLNLRIIADIRNFLYKHLLMLPVSYFDRNKSGEMISLVVNDVANLNNSMTSTFDKLLIEPIRLIFCCTMIFIINPKFALTILVILPVLALFINQIGKVIRRRSTRSMEAQAGLLSVLHETVNGIRAVKMFNMNAVEYTRFAEETKKFNRTSFRTAIASSVSSPIIETIGAFTVVVLLWFGGRVVLAEKGFNAGDFVQFLLFIFAAYRPLKAIGGIYGTIQSGFASADRVFKLIDTPREPLLPITEERLPTFTKTIQFTNVSFSYPECEPQVLRDINITATKGQIIAIVGSSGSGKSTILDLLPRFYRVTSGAILIDGENIDDLDLAGLRHLFGIVAQDTILFNETVFNNIAYSGGENVSEARVIEAAKASNAWEFIEKMPNGLSTIIGERGIMLSGGQRQRLSIARALLKNSPILILDEATSALDTESERLVQGAINNLMQNRTTFVVAHRLSTVTHADLILVLENGQIVEQGTHENLLKHNKRYRQLYDMQFAPVNAGVLTASAQSKTA